jgi:hypothetical protein
MPAPLQMMKVGCEIENDAVQIETTVINNSGVKNK